MDKNLSQIKTEIYDKCALELSGFKTETESKAYNACRFQLNGMHVLSRNAKITPKKAGQFVTFWKRQKNGPIEPFSGNDAIDFSFNLRADSSILILGCDCTSPRI